MSSNPSSFRLLMGNLRRLPSLGQELVVMAKDHRLLVEQVRRDEQRLNEVAARLVAAEDQVRGIGESVDRLHQTLVEADPHMAYEIVTSVRDDVRSLLVEVTEQSNLARDQLVARTQGSLTDS